MPLRCAREAMATEVLDNFNHDQQTAGYDIEAPFENSGTISSSLFSSSFHI